MKIEIFFYMVVVVAGATTTISPLPGPCLPALDVAQILTDDNPPLESNDIWQRTNADCYVAALLDTSRPLSARDFHDYLLALLSVGQIVEPLANTPRSLMTKMALICTRHTESIAKLVVEKHDRFWPHRYQYMHSSLLGNGTRDEREWGIRGLSWIVAPFWNLDNLCLGFSENEEILRIIMMEKLFRDQFIVGNPTPRKVHHVAIEISRGDILRDSALRFFGGDFLQFWRAKILGGIRIFFSNEPAVDTGGVFLDWVSEIFREFLEQEIFVPTAEGVNIYTLNNVDNIPENYFRTAGLVLGFCMLQDAYVPIELSLGIFKKLTAEFVKFEEMEIEDPIVWPNLRDFQISDDHFFVVNDRLGAEHELVRGGSLIQVTKETLPRFQRAMAEWKMVKSIQRELILVKEGFDLIVGENFFARHLSARELQSILCRSREPTLADLNGRLNLSFPPDMSEEVRSVWRVRVRNYFIRISQENKMGDLIEFITGMRALDSRPIKVQLVDFDDNDFRFPSASTCTRTLRIPVYSSEEIFSIKMQQTLENDGSREFGLT